MTSATFGFWYNSKHNGLGYKPNEVKTFTAEKEAAERDVAKDIKQIAVDFFYWWHNQPGTNTEEGFDRWWATVAQYHKDALHGIHCLQSSLAQAREEIAADGEELRRWQDEIRGAVIKASGVPDYTIDGGGCDSGDPLDFTLTEIAQGFVFLKEAAEQREKGLRDKIRAVLDYDQGHCRGDVATQLELWKDNAETVLEAALRTALLDPETIKAEVATERAALAAASKEEV